MITYIRFLSKKRICELQKSIRITTLSLRQSRAVNISTDVIRKYYSKSTISKGKADTGCYFQIQYKFNTAYNAKYYDVHRHDPPQTHRKSKAPQPAFAL